MARGAKPVVPYSIRLPPDVYEALVERAEKDATTMTAVILEALRGHLKMPAPAK